MAVIELLTNPTVINTMGGNALLWAEELGNRAILNFTSLLDEAKDV
jgi:hypothetical protein